MTNVSQLSQLERDFENLKLKIENASISIEKIKKSREVTNVDIKPTTLEFTKGDTSTTKRLRKFCADNHLYSTTFKQVPSNYYDTPLEERQKTLNATSTFHLCKSMIVENSQCKEKNCENKLNSQFYCVVLQYTSKLNSNKIMNFLREVNQGKISKSQYSIQLADLELSEKMTGFKRNAVTPIGMKMNIPIILDSRILNLKPNYM
jgi:hypothetical protein